MRTAIALGAVLAAAVAALSLDRPGAAADSCCGDAPQVAYATCTGAANCRACTSCRSCAHCAKRGGTCGVCAVTQTPPTRPAQPPPQPATDPAEREDQKDGYPPAVRTGPSYEVVRVVDGDTVVIRMEAKEVTVRLIGVDTPETKHPSKPAEAFGKEASAFAANLLRGESVILRPDQGAALATDRYGRTLAYVYRAPDGLFVNLEIVRQGYGHAYRQYPHRFMRVFEDYERRARAAGKGLWADADGG